MTLCTADKLCQKLGIRGFVLLTGYADRIFVSTLNKSQTNMACRAMKEKHLGNIFYIVYVPTVHKSSRAVIVHSLRYTF
jgi:hypothetical protein